ncbi:hypothetical protein [Streptosporangium sp. NPDC023615]|uniref:hypothetical protein n=1 Tax=Streptosporangium sp. NPDC023615 TaxID=3154794 RepID=UPI00342398FE
MTTANNLKTDDHTNSATDRGSERARGDLLRLLGLILGAVATLTVGAALLYVLAREWGFAWSSLFFVACAAAILLTRSLGRKKSDVAAVISGLKDQDERRNLISLKAGSFANKAALTFGSAAYAISALKGEGTEQLANAFAGIVSVSVVAYVSSTLWFSKRS